jgi:hypothetical protein
VEILIGRFCITCEFWCAWSTKAPHIPTRSITLEDKGQIISLDIPSDVTHVTPCFVQDSTTPCIQILEKCYGIQDSSFIEQLSSADVNADVVVLLYFDVSRMECLIDSEKTKEIGIYNDVLLTVLIHFICTDPSDPDFVTYQKMLAKIGDVPSDILLKASIMIIKSFGPWYITEFTGHLSQIMNMRFYCVG